MHAPLLRLSMYDHVSMCVCVSETENQKQGFKCIGLCVGLHLTVVTLPLVAAYFAIEDYRM